MEKIKTEPEIVELEDTGACGGWIGSPTAKNVLLYFHGKSFLQSMGTMTVLILKTKERVS